MQTYDTLVIVQGNSLDQGLLALDVAPRQTLFGWPGVCFYILADHHGSYFLFLPYPWPASLLYCQVL